MQGVCQQVGVYVAFVWGLIWPDRCEGRVWRKYRIIVKKEGSGSCLAGIKQNNIVKTNG
jgi:hypothetical protein